MSEATAQAVHSMDEHWDGGGHPEGRRGEGDSHCRPHPHERLDGRGYFRGLSAEQLTPTARVLAVADVADALMSARPDREAMPIDEVLAVIKRGRTTEFCPASVAALAASLNSVAA